MQDSAYQEMEDYYSNMDKGQIPYWLCHQMIPIKVQNHPKDTVSLDIILLVGYLAKNRNQNMKDKIIGQAWSR